MNIIGVGGLPRSGKDTLAELFIEQGYFGVSLGDIVRDQARVRHADKPDPISVKNMTETSNYLRSVHGADFALKEAIARYKEAQKTKDYKGLVVFSVRAPVEADFILENGGHLVWVDSKDETRWQRALSNLRPGEAEITLEEMKNQEALQEQPRAGTPESVQMNTAYIRKTATVQLDNNEDLDSFYAKAKKLVNELSGN